MTDDVNKLDKPADPSELTEDSLQTVAGGTDKPAESVSFSFNKIEVSYTQQKPQGTK